MSKARRGAGLRSTPNQSRGECPACKRTGIKLVYSYEKDTQKIQVCKPCHKALVKGHKTL